MANFHKETVEQLVDLVGAAGLESFADLKPKHINRRVQGTDIKTYAQLYPTIDAGCLLNADTIPEHWRDDWQSADAQRWSAA